MTYSWGRIFRSCVILGWSLLYSQQAIAAQVVLPLRGHPTDLKPSLNRIVELPTDNMEEIMRVPALQASLERTLIALQPSFIKDLSSIPCEAPLSAAQVNFFLEVQKKVLAANARCKFSVTLYVNHYLTAPELLMKLQEVTTKLNPDIINMAVASNGDALSPMALGKGIEYAHAHGQLVTYEGPMNMIPDGADGVVISIANGELKREDLNAFKARHHLPVIVQTSFAHAEKQKEITLLTRLAEGQSLLGYHFAYPLFLLPSSKNKDTSLIVTLRALMTRYN